MKNNPMIFRQFYNKDHEEFNHMFVMHDNGMSKYRDGPSLFGWGGDSLKRYTTQFNLELVYD